jgi:hypothetical protein
MRQTEGVSFGTEFVVKYLHAKHENRECCPQHGALNEFFAGLAFSAVTIAVSKAFLLPIAENQSPVGGKFRHQDRTLIFIAKPRRRSDSNHNMELEMRFQPVFA